MDELRAALDDWQADWSEWGDGFASGDSSMGGFSLNDHDNWPKEFRLLRAARAFLDADDPHALDDADAMDAGELRVTGTCNHFPGQTVCDWCRDRQRPLELSADQMAGNNVVHEELARRSLDLRNPPPGHAAFHEPDMPASEWRAAYFALARIAQEQLDECRAVELDPERLE